MSTTTVLYGIPNCDTVKKARAWLEAHAIPHVFHDFKKAGIDREMIDAWLGRVDWEVLINRKGTTWRKLSDTSRADVTGAETATALMLEAPSVIKRPVLVTGDSTCVGFSDALYQQIFKK